jgi:hypothetical protein
VLQNLTGARAGDQVGGPGPAGRKADSHCIFWGAQVGRLLPDQKGTKPGGGNMGTCSRVRTRACL